MALKRRVSRLVHLLCLFAVSTANKENYLHSGCAVHTSLSDILEDSLTINIKYPPPKDFSFKIVQDEVEVDMSYSNAEELPAAPRWTPMELVLQGVPQLKFKNGTTWLSGNENKKLTSLPAKDLHFLGGGFLRHCPQALPNWSVRRNKHPSNKVAIDHGQEEVFSLIASHETKISFSVNQKVHRLCWNSMTSSAVVLDVSENASACSNLPPSIVLWLKIAYRDQMVEVSDPSQHLLVHRTFFEKGKKLELTFLEDEVNGIVYVVHHLKGYPIAKGEPSQPKVTKGPMSDPKLEDNMCEVISTAVGVFAILVILILSLLVILFYNRWINARQILYLLKTQTHSHSNIAEKGKPLLPTRPPPTLKPVAEDNYLTPKELFGDQGRPKSEHIYEDMLPRGWAPKPTAAAAAVAPADVSKTNKAFDSPENHYDVPKKKKAMEVFLK